MTNKLIYHLRDAISPIKIVNSKSQHMKAPSCVEGQNSSKHPPNRSFAVLLFLSLGEILKALTRFLRPWRNSRGLGVILAALAWFSRKDTSTERTNTVQAMEGQVQFFFRKRMHGSFYSEDATQKWKAHYFLKTSNDVDSSRVRHGKGPKKSPVACTTRVACTTQGASMTRCSIMLRQSLSSPCTCFFGEERFLKNQKKIVDSCLNGLSFRLCTGIANWHSTSGNVNNTSRFGEPETVSDMHTRIF